MEETTKGDSLDERLGNIMSRLEERRFELEQIKKELGHEVTELRRLRKTLRGRGKQHA